MTFRDRLASRHAPALAAVLGGMLALPTLGVGELLDDHLVRAWALGSGARWDAFVFVPRGGLATLQEQGMIGWWASDDLALRFLRPLSSLSHAIDHALWPQAVWLMHLENVVLYALLCWLAARLVTRLHGPGLAVGVAALVFAIDESHGATVGWIGARNTLLACGFGLGAVLAHLRWRAWDGGGGEALEEPARKLWPWMPLSLACMAATLLSAEGGLCCFGYLLAGSLCFERGSLWRRLAPLAPQVALILAWRLAYVSLGFGASGSGIYLDLDATPELFAARALLYPAVISATQLSLPLADLILAAPVLTWVLVAMFGGVCWALWPVLREDLRARFWLLGMLFASVPLAATYPTSRTLMLSGLGGAALIGLAWARESEGRGRRIALGFLFGCNLILAPLAFVPVAYSSLMFEPPHRALAAELPEDAPVCVILNSPAELSTFYPRAIRIAQGRAWPAHTYVLFAGMQTLEVERVDAQTLELWTAEGWAALGIDRFTNDWSEGFEVGAKVSLEHVEIEVLEVSEDRRPTRIRAVFDLDLDAVSMHGFGRDGGSGTELGSWAPAVGERARFTAAL